MYNTVAKHLYLKQIDCHNKSSNPLAPYKVFTMLLTKFPMYTTLPWLVYFITGNLYLVKNENESCSVVSDSSETDSKSMGHQNPIPHLPPSRSTAVNSFLVHIFLKELSINLTPGTTRKVWRLREADSGVFQSPLKRGSVIMENEHHSAGQACLLV